MKRVYLLLALVLATSPALFAQVITFQDGVSPTAGYTGTEDTHIISWDNGDLDGSGASQLYRNADGTNAGSDAANPKASGSENAQNMGGYHLMEEGDNGGGSNDSKVLLVQFDLGNAIPAADADKVVSAKIGLYFDSLRDGNDNPPHDVYVNRILKPWAEGTGADNTYDGTDTPDNTGAVTWNSTGFELWQAIGAEGPADIAPTESVTHLDPGDVGKFVWFDVTESAKLWVADPNSNNGVKISQNVFPAEFLEPDLTVDGKAIYSSDPVSDPTVFPNARFVFRTSQHEEVMTRPKLVINMAPVGNVPLVNDNNRVVGMDGGNIYYNALVPGGSAASKRNLVLPPPGSGGGGSPGSGTGPAGLIAVISDTMGNMLAQGPGTASANGLTATVSADGAYSLSADASFSGAYVVGVGVGNAVAPMIAASAAAVDLNANAFSPGATFSGGSASVTVAPGGATLVVANAPVAAGSAGDIVTLSVDYTATANTANVALVGFDGAVAGNTVKYTNPGAAALAAGVKKNLSTSFVTNTGQVIPGFQVANTGSAAITVTLENLLVVSAGSVVNLAVPSAIPIGAWGSNLFGEAGYVDATASGGVIDIPASGGATGNAFANVSVPKGELLLACRASASEVDAGGTLVLTLVTLDGGVSCASFVDLAQLADETGVVTTATNSVDGAAGIVVIQSTGGNLSANGVILRTAKGPMDPGLLGM